MDPTLELILRIAAACVCGALIGMERTIRLKEAGIRTHTIVALGAALMMIVSKYGFLDTVRYQGDFDASRIASCVVTGISFLGAGVIFVRGNTIKGLTIAAGIWATAGIGLALGAGLYIIGTASTVLLIVVQLLLHRFVGGLDSISLTELVITAAYAPDILDRIQKKLSSHKMSVHKCHASKGTDNTITLRITVKSPKEMPFNELFDIFEHDEDILSFSM